MIYGKFSENNYVVQADQAELSAYSCKNDVKCSLKSLWGIPESKKHACKPICAMFGRKRCFVTVALVNFNLAVPLVSVQ